MSKLNKVKESLNRVLKKATSLPTIAEQIQAETPTSGTAGNRNKVIKMEDQLVGQQPEECMCTKEVQKSLTNSF